MAAATRPRFVPWPAYRPPWGRPLLFDFIEKTELAAGDVLDLPGEGARVGELAAFRLEAVLFTLYCVREREEGALGHAKAG